MDNKKADIVHLFMHNKVPRSLRLRFWQWLISDNDTELKESTLQQEWAATSRDYCPDSSLHKSWSRVSRKAGLHTAPRLIWRHIAAAAACIAIVVSAAIAGHFIFPAASHSELQQFTVAAGHTGRITLPDGTEVMANAGSTIIYPENFCGDTRTIYMSGEANFDVSPDPNHPFVVKTPLLSVTALGTRFNVQSYPEDRFTVTSLQSGKVSVASATDPQRQTILNPGDMLSYDRLTDTFRSYAGDAAIAAGWMDGELNFIDSSIENILAVTQRHYGVEIKADPRIFTPHLYNIRLKSNETLENAMHIITITIGGIQWQSPQPGTIVLQASASSSDTKKGGAMR